MMAHSDPSPGGGETPEPSDRATDARLTGRPVRITSSLLRAVALAGLLVGAVVTPACNLVAGVDDLGTSGACATAGALRCNGNTPQECGANGQWKDAAQGACVGGTCDEATGKCAGACAAGQSRCAGNTSQACGPTGQWKEGTPCEASNRTCDPATGVCAGVCAPGQKKCGGNTAQACGPTGQWQDSAPCEASNQTCDPATGTCQGVCAPAQKRCGGTTPEACDAGGQWLASGPPCTGASHCKGGACVVSCTTGDLRCGGDTPQECDDQGEWQDAAPVCPVCVDCDPATAACETAPKALCADPTAIAAGSFHTCAVLPGGSVKCWGYGAFGALGLGEPQDRGDDPGEMGAALPTVDLGQGEAAKGITAGLFHTCALFTTGDVKCWGGGGALGLGDAQSRGALPGQMGAALPTVDLGPGEAATGLVAADGYTCALLGGGRVKCWGSNDHGQLGLGDTQSRGDGPNEMGSLLPAVDLGAGEKVIAVALRDYHTCAVLEGGSVKCWGGNAYGQLGLGDTQDRGGGPNQMGDMLPKVDLGAGEKAIAIASGYLHTCALLEGGSVKCWGYNGHGQLGLGDTQSRGAGPNQMGDMLPKVDLGEGKKAIAIGAGEYDACALLEGGQLKCWGDNAFGQLGLGDPETRGDAPGEMGDALPPIDVGPGDWVTAIAVGNRHTCAVLAGGKMKCWGYDFNGHLGLGDTLNRGDDPGEMGVDLQAIDL